MELIGIADVSTRPSVSPTWWPCTSTGSSTATHPSITSSSSTWVTLGQLNRLPEAGAAYREAIKLKPDFGQAWFNLGSTLERLGRKEHALTIWQSMLDHPLATPGSDPALYLLVVNGMGRLLEEMRQFERAEAKLQDRPGATRPNPR